MALILPQQQVQSIKPPSVIFQESMHAARGINRGIMRGVGVREVTQPAQGEFVLSDLINIRAWYEDDDETTITESGGFVSQHDDKSGYGYHKTQPTGSNQPETGIPARAINGLNCFNYDGGNDFMYMSGFRFSNTTDFVFSSGVSFAFVYQTDTVSTGSLNAQIIDNSVGSTGTIVRLDDDVWDIYFYDQTNTLRGLSDVGSVSTSSPGIVIVKFTTTGVYVYENGVLLGTDTYTGVTAISGTSGMKFAIRDELNGPWNGAIPFFIACNDNWNNAQMNNIFSLLGSRYAISVSEIT